MRLSPSRDLVRPNLRCVAAFGTARTAPSQRPVVTRPHAALLCRHTAPTLPHIAAALAPSSPLCACGRELHGANYVDGRRPASSTCTVAEDAAGRVGILPACAARASQAAWIAPAEPPASGEAQCADGEVREERGSAGMQCTVAG